MHRQGHTRHGRGRGGRGGHQGGATNQSGFPTHPQNLATPYGPGGFAAGSPAHQPPMGSRPPANMSHYTHPGVSFPNLGPSQAYSYGQQSTPTPSFWGGYSPDHPASRQYPSNNMPEGAYADPRMYQGPTPPLAHTGSGLQAALPNNPFAGAPQPQLSNPQYQAPAFTDTPRHRPLNPAAAEFRMASPERAHALDRATATSSQGSDASTIRPGSAQNPTAEPRSHGGRPSNVDRLSQGLSDAIDDRESSPRRRLENLQTQKLKILADRATCAANITDLEKRLGAEESIDGTSGILEQLKDAQELDNFYGKKWDALMEAIEEFHTDNAVPGSEGDGF